MSTRFPSPPPVYDARPSTPALTTLRPYLQLPHLLSLTWLAYPILSLLFVAFRLQLSIASSEDAVENARGDLLTACQAAEHAATAAASMPRYMAAATNQQFADAVNGTMNGARAALVLTLTVMEAIINFIVDLYRSTFLCFLELVVRGGLSLLISAVQEITSAVQGATSAIRTNIQNDVASANSAIQSVADGLNKLKVFGNVSIPQFSIPSLDALQNVSIPNDFENALVSLNNSLPTLSELKDAVTNLIDTPFELVKKDINDTFANITFNAAVLPVPQQNTLSFCGDLDTSVVDDLGKDLLKAAKIGTIILILMALLLLAGNCLLEWYKWKCLKRHLQYTREAWSTDPTMYHPTGATGSAPTITMSDHNLLMLQASSSHPLLTRITNTISAKLRLSPSKHINLQFFFNYVFHPPALACFLIGFFGLLSVQLQLFAIGPLEAKYTAQAQASVKDFSGTIAASVNASMYNQSAAYANDVNGRVDSVQQTINEGMFGWVNGTTTSLNDTLNTFYDDIQDAVGKVFNGTILESPVQEFIRCLIGSKVDAFENALTFLHDNLHVDMPRVNDSVLVLSPADVNEATQPIATAAIGGGNDNSQGLVGRLVATYVNSLKKERIMFGIFMGLWGVVVLMALAIILWHSYGVHWLEAHRRRKWKREQRTGFEDFAPQTQCDVGTQEKGEKATADLPSFTPLSPAVSRNPFTRARNEVYPVPEPDRLRPNHALNELNPKFEKSWDSFTRHDNADAEPSDTRKSMSKLRRLMAIGRKAMGKEQLVGDGSSDEGSHSENGWLDRVKGKFRRNNSDESYEPSVHSTGSGRARPNLTIETGGASQYNSRQAVGGPTSAWSVSPTPPRKPWANLRSKRDTPPAFPPVLPLSPRRKPSVPSDITNSMDDLSAIAPALRPTKAPKPTPLAMPLYNSFERPIPDTPHSVSHSPSPAPNALAAPPDRHRRTSSVPAAAWTQPADDHTPVTRFLTTNHARQSSVAVNPFATPFDDEARATNQNTHAHTYGHRRSQTVNPFAGVAY